MERVWVLVDESVTLALSDCDCVSEEVNEVDMENDSLAVSLTGPSGVDVGDVDRDGERVGVPDLDSVRVDDGEPLQRP